MFRGLALALVVLLTPHTGVVQVLSVLRIKVIVVDSAGRATPVPRHALLISDNPASAPPRRILTSLEGLADVRLAPGSYTVESDRPVALDGKAYQWTMVVDVVGGRDAVLELTGENADVVPITDAASSEATPPDADPSSLLATWKDSVVAIWTATAHGSGLLIDSQGLVVADQHVIGAATSVEVQLSASVKVAGVVVASDAVRGIALVRINPSVPASGKAHTLQCETTAGPLAVGDEITAIEAPLDRLRGTRSGSIDVILPNVIESSLRASEGGSGAPVFGTAGQFIGLTTLVPERAGERSDRTRIVRVGRLCEVVASAAEKIKATAPPSDAHLPVEPLRPFPVGSAGGGAKSGASRPSPYQLATSDFDIEFITPVHVIASEGAQAAGVPQFGFGNWSAYVDEVPPVLLVRVTPRFVESFWAKIARGAVMTQGVSLPPLKRPKSNFERMRALCGDAEVVPVHPFILEHRLTDKDAIVEGLYVFDPEALTPACATVTLQVFSEKEPRKADTLVVDSKVIQQIWQDFAPHRVTPRVSAGSAESRSRSARTATVVRGR
jgi:S1-C subfamily serine protease